TGGVEFPDTSHGWFALGADGDLPQSYTLLVTSDGGTSWQIQPFALPSIEKTGNCDQQSLDGYAPKTVFFSLVCKDRESFDPSTERHYLYRSEDLGAHWTMLLLKGYLTESVSSSVLWQLVWNDDRSISRYTLYRTLNGGQTWQYLGLWPQAFVATQTGEYP